MPVSECLCGTLPGPGARLGIPHIVEPKTLELRYEAGRLLVDVHDVVSVFLAAGAEDSDRARITLLHIPPLCSTFEVHLHNSLGVHFSLRPRVTELSPTCFSRGNDRPLSGLGWRAGLSCPGSAALSCLHRELKTSNHDPASGAPDLKEPVTPVTFQSGTHSVRSFGPEGTSLTSHIHNLEPTASGAPDLKEPVTPVTFTIWNPQHQELRT
ncbi:unnamed protein product [Pleuronectes platessa]|uniref:Uncharacterized protein n=1 Tax=Pleuronectes platessa TaxID=8262 RepID=A0A9N7TSQ0_PLEPL|nr:unnamed protein product [Pleuronectes platessa]